MFLNELRRLQQSLESFYGAPTGLDVSDFLRVGSGIPGLGRLLVQWDAHSADNEADVALLLDVDVLAAWRAGRGDGASVLFEELSHFVYFAFNHRRGRSVTTLEMEIQSEVDRIWLAFHGPLPLRPEAQQKLLTRVMEQAYERSDYERSRKSAAAWLRGLRAGKADSWQRGEFEQLRRFYHADLGAKLHMIQASPVRRAA